MTMKITIRLLIIFCLSLLVTDAPVTGQGFGRGGAVGGGGFRGPAGGAGAGGYKFQGYGGPAGGIVGGSKGGIYQGPGGGMVIGGAKGGTVTGPGGKTVSGGKAGGVVVGPDGGIYAGAKKGVVGSGPGGTIVGGSKAGVGVAPKGGVAVGGARPGAVTLPTDGGLARYGNVAVGGKRWSTIHVPAQNLRVYGTTVRSGFVHYNYFTPQWYVRYPTAWRAPRWTVPNLWATTTWLMLANYCSYPVQPIYYDFGTTIIYQGDIVYIDGEKAGSAEKYSQQAQDLAGAGKAAKDVEADEWQPLGVFAMVHGEETDANHIFQLAVDKRGVLRGNYYNALADTTVPIYGAVDKKTQRAAWTVGDKTEPVYEAGIANLTRDETTILVHFGMERTQQWNLVRLDQKAGK